MGSKMGTDVWTICVCTLTLLLFSLTEACHQLCDCDRYTPSRMTCEDIEFSSDELRTLVIPDAVSELRLVDNGIEEISSEILEQFVNLTSLEISDNTIHHIPPHTFHKFKNLKTLKLKRNKIRTVDRDSFLGLRSLKKIDLSNNEIRDLDPNTFADLRTLQEVKLIYNKLHTVPNGLFTVLPDLRDVFLTKNNISTIGDRAFQNLTMKRIGLTHNKLKRIPVGAFRGLTVRLKILLYFNPLECLCKDLMDYAMNLKHLTNRILGECESPYEVKDKHLLSAYKETTCTQCDLNPCHNGGKCTGDKNWYTCQCTERYKGRNCGTSICELKIKYVERVVYVPGSKTVVSYQRGDRMNETDPEVTGTGEGEGGTELVMDEDAEKKLMILYAMCSLEFIVILCFVALFMWKRYQDWKLLKEYDHQKRKQILEKIRNTTNKKLQESLY